LESSGGVLVTHKDQTASGDGFIFDSRANSVTLSGKVVITQGRNVLKGDRLIVDLVTGMSRMEVVRRRMADRDTALMGAAR
jgi:lipopolysaccharide export system protein LptA